MQRVLVTPPAAASISIAEAKAKCRVEDGDEDLLLQHCIDAVTALLDVPAGILGRCLVNQRWRLELAARSCQKKIACRGPEPRPTLPKCPTLRLSAAGAVR